MGNESPDACWVQRRFWPGGWALLLQVHIQTRRHRPVLAHPPSVAGGSLREGAWLLYEAEVGGTIGAGRSLLPSRGAEGCILLTFAFLESLLPRVAACTRHWTRTGPAPPSWGRGARASLCWGTWPPGTGTASTASSS